MSHWATDEIIVQLQREHGEMNLQELQRVTRIGQDDFTAGVAELKDDGLITIVQGTVYLAENARPPQDPPADEAETDDLPEPELPEVEEEPEAPEGQLHAAEAALALLEQMQSGEDAVVTAEVELRTNGNGALELHRVTRVLGVHLER